MLRIYWHCSSGSDCSPHSNTDLDLVKVKSKEIAFFLLMKVITVKSKAIVFYLDESDISSLFSFSANVLSLENPPMSECVRKQMVL